MQVPGAQESDLPQSLDNPIAELTLTQTERLYLLYWAEDTVGLTLSDNIGVK